MLDLFCRFILSIYLVDLNRRRLNRRRLFVDFFCRFKSTSIFLELQKQKNRRRFNRRRLKKNRRRFFLKKIDVDFKSTKKIIIFTFL